MLTVSASSNTPWLVRVVQASFTFGVVLCLTALPVCAQDSGAGEQSQGVLEALRESPIPVPGATPEDDGTDIQQSVWCPEISDDETLAACWMAYRARLEYYKSGLEHRSRVFWWQHMSTRIIFGVVLLLVGAGVYFAWVQFRHDLGMPGEGAEERVSGHTVELSTSGIKVSSPVLGVIILALSLAFFYLYLIYVYPITEIF